MLPITRAAPPARPARHTPTAWRKAIGTTHNRNLRSRAIVLLVAASGCFTGLAEPWTVCPKCRSEDVRPTGAGTQRVEAELERLFPGVPLVRMDLDTTRGRNAHSELGSIGDALGDDARHRLELAMRFGREGGQRIGHEQRGADLRALGAG